MNESMTEGGVYMCVYGWGWEWGWGGAFSNDSGVFVDGFCTEKT